MEHEAQNAVAAMHVNELTAEVKADILNTGESVKGAHLQAVYINGAVRWDVGELNRYAEDHLDLLRFKSDGEPGVTIRAVK